ncbi:hypothetical protein [Chryseobacterium sp. BIGb0232]|uniref:hypothetical protein n=1 Tax=Chryseobacterium sp. BIGb0232 TaxID=2940598 RepID=UPI000F48643A|nr:hypothetical protein [Chryseobacterium sp. BIGb0232]MCS4303773.1 hypothetical protein [Chryseobacterium sp. BIGb0232]ROS11688.1 hypothetical protein EDF65_4112 [Chryseobacterium nakagawai]
MNMNNHSLKKIILKRYLYISLLIISCYVKGQVVNVTGNWTASIPAITEAGNNYSGTYDNSANTAPNQIVLSGSIPDSVIKLLSSSGAKITMRYVSNPWHSSLGLSAKRVGGTASISGLCLGCTVNINGGTTYIPISSATDVTLSTITFSGLLGIGNHITYSGIVVNTQISGVSVTIPASTYSARVVFTIVAN